MKPRVWNRHHPGYPQHALYCGRGTIAGNPFVAGRDGTRDEVCDKYEEWAPRQPWYRAMLLFLRGKDLLCSCKPKRCHCDFLLKEANRNADA